MATGSGPLGVNMRGGETTAITPTFDVPSLAPAFEELTRIGRRFDGVVNDALDKRAARKGAADGIAAAGGATDKEPSFWMSDARKSAFESSYKAAIRTDIDSRISQAQRDNAYDPQGFKAEADKIVSGFVGGAPGDFAVDVELYARDKVAGAYDMVARARTNKDQTEAVNTLTARETALQDEIIDLVATPGGRDDPRFVRMAFEWEEIQTEKANNPLFAFTPEQADLKRAALTDRIAGTVVSTEAVTRYAEGGKGEVGYVAAKNFLSKEFMKGPEFQDIAPEKRTKYFAAALRNVEAVYAGDKAEADLKAAQEREEKARAREYAGDVRLKVMLGEVGEAEILNDAGLDDAAKASLISGARAQARRDAADARRDAAIERVGRVATYNAVRDQADAGTLSPGEIADHVQSGLLTPGQARTLAAKRDKSIKPIIDNVLGPLKDKLKDRGGLARDVNVMMAKAEEEAAVWSRMNTDKPLDEQQRIGEMIAKKYLGGEKKTRKDLTISKSDQLSALEKIKSTMPDSEYKRRRKEIKAGV